MDKIELENPTSTQITSKERIDRRLWNSVALREAIINSIVHNDFIREVPPEFAIFLDPIEITSAGILPEGLSEDEFFDGVSIPRNREFMRVFRDLELVIEKIVYSYNKPLMKHIKDELQNIIIGNGQDGQSSQLKKIQDFLRGNANAG